MVRPLLPALMLAPALVGCDLSSCDNDPLDAVAAPDGRHVATIFRRSCGATTGFSPQVSLIAPGERPSGLGNVFILGDDDPAPRVEWLGPDRLRISYRRGAEIFLRERARHGVAIEYWVIG